jgi:hypothetical protein
MLDGMGLVLMLCEFIGYQVVVPKNKEEYLKIDSKIPTSQNKRNAHMRSILNAKLCIL